MANDVAADAPTPPRGPKPWEVWKNRVGDLWVFNEALQAAVVIDNTVRGFITAPHIAGQIAHGEGTFVGHALPVTSDSKLVMKADDLMRTAAIPRIEDWPAWLPPAKLPDTGFKVFKVGQVWAGHNGRVREVYRIKETDGDDVERTQSLAGDAGSFVPTGDSTNAYHSVLVQDIGETEPLLPRVAWAVMGEDNFPTTCLGCGGDKEGNPWSCGECWRREGSVLMNAWYRRMNRSRGSVAPQELRPGMVFDEIRHNGLIRLVRPELSGAGGWEVERRRKEKPGGAWTAGYCGVSWFDKNPDGTYVWLKRVEDVPAAPPSAPARSPFDLGPLGA
jgi:hypothetical protein